MNQVRITQLLRNGSQAAAACRAALIDGAELILWQGSAPADRMLAAYRRRHALVMADAIDSIGFTEALDDLQRAGIRELHLGQVTVAFPSYVYTLFLINDPPELVACLGVART
jgi:hypothetical protein